MDSGLPGVPAIVCNIRRLGAACCLCLIGLQGWAAAAELAAPAAVIPLADVARTVPASPPALPQNAPQASVLVVSTDEFSSPYVYSLFSSYQTALRQQFGPGLTLYTENLQFAQFGDPAYRLRLQEWIRQKYEGRGIQAVLAIGNSSLKFLTEAGHEILPQVPVVVVATTVSVLAATPHSDRVTGLTGQLRLADTVGLVKTLLPDTRQLALIGNLAQADDYRPFYAPDLDALRKDIGFIDLRGLPLETLMQRVRSLPADAAIYFTRATVDAAGRSLNSQDLLARVLAVAPRPVFVDNATPVGSGVVGGVVAEPERRGQESATITQQLLSGVPVSTIPVVSGKLATVLDWRALQRWQVDSRRVPKNAELRFYQPGFLERYFWQASAVAVFIALQFLTVIALLIERRQRARAVRQSQLRLREIAHMNRNTTATIYSAAIAHELNQPLSSILSNTEAAAIFLARDPPELGEVREILTDVTRDTLRATDLIRSMRTLLKKSDTDPQPFDLNAAAGEVLAFLASEASMRQVSLISALSRTPLPVLADRVQIRQVLINLIINGMDAMESAGTARRFITVRTGLTATGKIEMEVSDTGPGFQEDLKKVFDSFFTTKTHGMGLGLSITAAIIEAHGGRISASNATHGGALVSILLPAAALAPAPEAA